MIGNTKDGDGCSSECQVETGFRCIASEEDALAGRSADVCFESARRTSRIRMHGGNSTDRFLIVSPDYGWSFDCIQSAGKVLLRDHTCLRLGLERFPP